MPDYTTGTYIIKTNKIWNCFLCNKEIKPGEKVFARIEEYGEERTRTDGKKYRLKNYKRFHLSCAKKLDHLNLHERALLQQFKVELNSVYGKASKASVFATDYIKKVLEELEKHGYKVAYMDTDSIFLKKTG